MTGHAELIDQLIALGRKAVGRGLVLGSGGNLSARLPGADECVVTASGTWLDELSPDDFSVVALDGAHRAGHPRPSSEVALHLHSYRARSDVNAVIHLHPQLSVLLDALGHRIRLITIDHAYYVRGVATVPYIASGTEELAVAGAAALADADAVILGHHGCSVVGATVEEAHKRAANLEEAATATYRALLLGDTTTVCPPEYLERIRRLEAEAVEAGGAAATPPPP
ncbi:MAG: class II aldolase/adducin family protein [Actinobacteria bacterium]|nr:class II aldolase/adducin family protein [Actinomycetota bacterium]